MKEEFKDYLKSLEFGLLYESDINDIIDKRVKPIYNFFENICPEEIKNIFATDSITGSGEKRTRELRDLWFFSDKYIMGARNFSKKNELEIYPIHQICHLSIKTQNTEMQVKLLFGQGMEVNFIRLGNEGSKRENLKKLQEIIKHILNQI